MSLEGKVVLVTGASMGIGKAYATAFARAGATVLGVARSFDDPELAAPLSEENGQVLRWPCDVRDEKSVVETVARAISELGRIDVLINNAGICPHHATLATSVEAWNQIMEVNVRGVYLMIREVAPHMVDRGSGAIASMSSGSAFHTGLGTPGHGGLLAYGVSKAAVNRMTDFIAEDLAPSGVAVNALRPGAVLTDSWREIDPENFALVRDSGRGQACTPEIVGPPMLCLAKQTPATMTGQVVNALEFGKTWS